MIHGGALLAADGGFLVAEAREVLASMPCVGPVTIDVVLAEVGDPLTGFQGFGGVGDMPAPGQGIGSFFLTDDGPSWAFPCP